VQDWLTLLVAQDFKDVELWASAKSFTDVFYVTQKAVGSMRLQQMFLESLKFLHVCSIGLADIQGAAQLAWDDFEDCLIDVAARKVKAAFIITRDASGFSQSKIPALSAHDFIAWQDAEKGLSYESLSLGS